jgi:predicted nuclease of restriction endonuclease-like (RecB) superfamily
MEFQNLLENVVTTHNILQAKAIQTINQTLTLRNWCIGAYIVEYEQAGKDRAEYGKKLFETLSKSLEEKGIKGFRPTELKNCRGFYLAYRYLLNIITQTQQNDAYKTLNVAIRQTLSVELQTNDEITIKRYSLIFQKLSYSHLIELSKVENETARQYYELLALKTTLSVRELRRQIASLAYEREGLSQNKEATFEQIIQKIQPQNPADIIKDLYVFEFLGLPAQHIVSEETLETGLLEHLQAFILELGNGFCFEARQKRILIGDEYFFVDLVFYHRILKCHVLLELKIDKMHVGHIAQLKTYLNYYDIEIKEKTDNPPIGILLVTDKNDALVQYAMPEKDAHLFISKYKLQLPSEEELFNFIKKEIQNL